MSKQGRKWTPEEDGKLLELKAAGKSLSFIAKELNRTQAAIDSRASGRKKMKVTVNEDGETARAEGNGGEAVGDR
jgi:hypothetical protein